jgi:hypothetical protein
MAYQEPKEKKKPVPSPNWTHVLENEARKMYDFKKPSPAKMSKVGGYDDSGVSKKDYGNVDQGITKDGEKLPSRDTLKVDPPSKQGFWPADDATSSGQDAGDIAENFTAPHGGRSRGQKYPKSE